MPEPLAEVIPAETADPSTVSAVVEAYGLSCGRLEPLLGAAMRALEPGQIVEVRSDETAAREGVPSWCWLTGHALVSVSEDDERHTRFYLKKKST